MEVPSGARFSCEFHWSDLWRERIKWRGVTAWKCPLDLWSYQQILHDTRPELVIESGVAAGGTTLFLADVLDQIGHGRVIGVDSNLDQVAPVVRRHPRIELVETSSLDPGWLDRLRHEVIGRRAMVILDSDHRPGFVLRELRAYADLVAPGCYLVCEDGNIDRPDGAVSPGCLGPHHALTRFLGERADFAPDETRVLGATFNPLGYLLRVATEAAG